MGRILAIDYGTKRTGIAVSDPLRIIAGGLETVPTKELEKWLASYCSREEVDVIVLGKPSRMDGTPSETWRYIETVKEDIFRTDIIYVGGGNTKFMLEKWRELGVDKILQQAYEKGIVCSGLSAGSYCWFRYNYDLLEGIGVINAINCVHYEQKGKAAREKFYQVIQQKQLDGIALDNCVALEIVDGQCKIIKSNKDKNAYRITYQDGKWIEEIL